MSRTKPVMRPIEVLLLIERNGGGLRGPDMAEQKSGGLFTRDVRDGPSSIFVAAE